MAAIAAAPVTAPRAKRKRAAISYADDDDELDRMLEVDTEAAVNNDHNLEASDVEYGSRKKANKKRKLNKDARAKTTRAKSSKREKPFPFLSLPAELRDQIYELALTQPGGVTLVSKTKAYRRTVTRGAIPDPGDRWHGYRSRRRHHTSNDDQSESARNDFVPALLAVNKQIHAEAVGYLYKQSFILADTMALHNFIAAIGSNRLLVTDLTVKEWGFGRGAHKAMNFGALTLLAGCTNLQSLSLDCSIGYFVRKPKNLARQIIRDGCYFLEAIGSARGRKDAALDVLKLADSNFDKDGAIDWYGRRADVPDKDEFKDQFHQEVRKLLGCK